MTRVRGAHGRGREVGGSGSPRRPLRLRRSLRTRHRGSIRMRAGIAPIGLRTCAVCALRKDVDAAPRTPREGGRFVLVATADEKDTGYYDRTYERAADDLYAAIRQEAFREDIGQFSWLTADEYRRFFTLLGIDAGSDVLEVASGSGGPALFMAQETGCRVTGLDIHQAGVDAANTRAEELGLADRARFVCSDARDPLPSDDASFDALTCIDSFNHLYERERVLGEWHRVLRPGARMLFTDPIIVSGMIRREEMIVRSGSMGEFVFTAPGVDDQVVRDAGFVDIRVEDVTENMSLVASRWRAARARHKDDLDRIEGVDGNAAFQHFLDVVDTLARERRLSRLAYFATKPA